MKKIFTLFCTFTVFAITTITNPSVSKSDESAFSLRELLRHGQASCEPCEPVCNEPCEPVSGEPCEAVSEDKLAGCNLGCEVACDADNFFTKYSRGKREWRINDIEISGWIQSGIYVNSHGAKTTRLSAPNYDGRTVSAIDDGNGDFFGNTQSTDFQVNQVWVEFVKEADGKHGLDWGFGAGLFFGTDAWFTQSLSDAGFDYGWQSGDYYTSIPELYFQLAYGDLSVKVGKFETYLGYESLKAPDAIFYSHPYSFMIEPATHSGVLAEYAPTENLQLVLAYTSGADGSPENIFDDHGLLSSISYQLTQRLNLTYTMSYQKYSNQNYKTSEDREFAGKNVYFHTFLAKYDLTKRLSYTLQWTLADAKIRADSTHENAKAIGNYLKYKLNDFLSVGFRTEWFAIDGGGDFSEHTLGLTWQPQEDLIIRPEIRFDHSSNKIDKAFNDGRSRDQLSGGITTIVKF